MLHIVPELMLVSALVTGLALPAPRSPVSETPPTMVAAAPAPGHDNGESVPAGFGRATPADRLQDARGGTGIVSDTRLGGEVANNSAQQFVTGANNIADGSFSGSVGLPVVIQNSGANVLIQNATVINLQFK